MKISAISVPTSRTMLRAVLSLLLITASTLSYQAHGRQIDEHQAAALATEFLSGHSSAPHSLRKASPRIAGTAMPSEKSEYYIFNADNSFVIISGDDGLRPIVGYSFSGTLDPDNIPVQLADFLNSYEKGVESFRAGTRNAGKSSAGGTAVAPLISTKWNQGAPYNNLCIPQYGTNNFYTGCVATAIAQVMKYHNYPPSGKGVTEDRWENPSIDLSKSTYDWNNMLDEYSNQSWNEAEGIAVARLMRDIGAAVWMEYGTSASSAIWTYIAPALYRNFNYSPDIAMRSRESYGTDEWMAIIRENILRGEPIIYGGAGNMGGHEFVVDGIDENDYVHINWGWGGSSDGYFDINALAPEVIGTGGGDGRFYRDHTMIVNIRPGDPDADNSGLRVPFMAWNLGVLTTLDADGRLLSDSKKEVEISFMMSNNTRAHVHGSSTLKICTSLYDKDKNLVNKNFGRPSGIQHSFSRDTYYEENISVDLSTLEDGEYYLSLWYTHDVDMEFDFASDPYIHVVVKDGEIYFPETVDTDNALSVVNAVQTNVIYNQLYGNIEIKLNNSGRRLLKGNIDVYCLPEDGAPDSPAIADLGASIASVYYFGYGYSTSSVIASVGTPPATGRYRLYFVFNNRLLDTADKYFIEISPLPTDVPFVITAPLKTEMAQYENTNHEWMEITLNYAVCDGWTDWMRNSMDFRFTAAPEDNPDDTFILFEVTDTYFLSSPRKLAGGPNIMWKKPGKYRFWMSYKLTSDSEWITPDDHNNTGTFILSEEVPAGPIVDMAAPMVINGGNDVAPGSDFEVSLKIKTPTGISIKTDQSYARVTDDPMSYISHAFYRSMEFGKTELAAGEETDIKLSFFMPDNPEYYNKSFLVLLDIYYEEYYAVIPRPGEYLESLYFTVNPSAGIENIEGETFRCILSGNEVRIEGIAPGDEICVTSINGTVVKRIKATGSVERIPVTDMQKGFYILTINSPFRNYPPLKFKNL